MKSRHVRSPDLADALATTFAPQASMVAVSLSPTEMEAEWAEAGLARTAQPFMRRRLMGGWRRGL